MKLKSKRTFVLVGVLAVAAFSAIGAYAYWTTTGTGTGSATAGTATAVSITQTSTVSAMYPGGPAQALDFDINNPGPSNQYVASVSIAISSITGGTGGCTNADFTLVQPTVVPGDLTPGNHSYAPSGASLKMNETGVNQDGCKNVTVNLAYTANPA